MDSSNLIPILRNYKVKHQNQYGIARLGLFGSVVRNEAQKLSDIDVVVELQKQDLFLLIGIKQDLEKIFNKKIDVISYRNTMNPFLKRRIDSEAIYA